MKKIALTVIFAGATLMAADGAALFAKCAGCHGQKAEKKALGKSNVIAGKKADVILKDLQGYKAGTLNRHGMGGVMKGQTAALSDDDMKALADYISKLGGAKKAEAAKPAEATKATKPAEDNGTKPAKSDDSKPAK